MDEIYIIHNHESVTEPYIPYVIKGAKRIGGRAVMEKLSKTITVTPESILFQ